MSFIRSVINWIKNNKLATLLAVVLLLVFLSKWGTGLSTQQTYPTSLEGVGSEEYAASERATGEEDASGQKVIQETTMSLVVEDVEKSADTILEYAKAKGGFMVSSSITRGESSTTGTVVVRVPAAELKTATEYLRGLAVKVASEYLEGIDVSETYADYEARIATLQGTIAQLEEIKKEATEIDDLVSITNQIVSLQGQIDTYRGLMRSLSESAAYSRITTYLATDELSLPYEPPTGFRPTVVFKQAVRALLTDLYALASALIWVGVYGVFWVPALGILVGICIIRKRYHRRPSS